MFNLILQDSDFELENGKLLNPRTRYGARGIIMNSKGQIAIFNKRAKNEFKLPGGGIDEREDPKSAFEREALEETGCKLKNVELIGIIEERQFKENFVQKSYVFKSIVAEDMHKLALTQKEIDEKAVLIWLEPKDALERLSCCMSELKASSYDNVYRSRFMVKRDIMILSEFLKDYE